MIGESTTVHATFDELASVLMLCMLLSLVLLYLRTSISRKRKFVELACSVKSQPSKIQQNTPIIKQANLPSSYTNTVFDHHPRKKATEKAPCPSKVRKIAKKRQDIPRVSFDLTRNIIIEYTEKPTALPWVLRRSRRARQTSKRAAKSWCSGHLRALGSRLVFSHR